jgi:hypothetical protein
MKVHVTLTKPVRSDPKAKQDALEAIEQQFGMRDINLRRFERYGVITGELPQSKLEDVQQLDTVEAVQADERRRAT